MSTRNHTNIVHSINFILFIEIVFHVVSLHFHLKLEEIKKYENKKTFAYNEKISHLKVEENASHAFLYKRNDCELHKNLEDKTFYVSISLPRYGNGKRLSLF